jgi:hypothetical protein
MLATRTDANRMLRVHHYENSGSENATVGHTDSHRKLKKKSSLEDLHILSQGELCSVHEDAFYSCSRQLTVLVVLQGTLYPSMQVNHKLIKYHMALNNLLYATMNFILLIMKGCDKRVYHVVEALVGLNHKVITTIYQRGKAATSSEDNLMMSFLAIEKVKEPLRRNIEESYR